MRWSRLPRVARTGAVIVAMLLAAGRIGAAAEAFGVAELMGELAQHHNGRAHFVEKHYVALLDAPVVSSGDLSFTAPDQLVKHTLLPHEEMLTLSGTTVNFDRDRQHTVFDLSDHPEIGALVESIRATLDGDRGALERNYRVTLSGSREHWTMILLPIDDRVARAVARVTLTGASGVLQTVEYLQPDGDRSVMTIEALSSP